MHRALVGGHVQRVHVATMGGRRVVLLHVRSPGETRYVVAATGLGIGTLTNDLRQRLREAMKAVDEEKAVSDRAADRAANRATWETVVRDAERFARQDEDLDEAGARVVQALALAESDGRRVALRRALEKAMAKVDRRIEAVRGDLTKAEQSDEMARRAQLFVVEAARAPRGATRLVTSDWSTGTAQPVEMALDPSKPARVQIDALFQRSRRLKEGAGIGRERLADAERSRAALSGIAQSLADPLADVPALAARAKAIAPRDFKLPSGASTPAHRAKKQPRRPAYRDFRGASGARIWVGRGAEHNDELTFHVARPHDLWLHAKNRTGAHVVVPLEKNASCPADWLVEAAHLAAHFSEARDESVVEVQYSPRRYVRKPKGSAAGAVLVDREKVLVLRVEPALLRALLEREVVG